MLNFGLHKCHNLRDCIPQDDLDARLNEWILTLVGSQNRLEEGDPSLGHERLVFCDDLLWHFNLGIRQIPTTQGLKPFCFLKCTGWFYFVGHESSGWFRSPQSRGWYRWDGC